MATSWSSKTCRYFLLIISFIVSGLGASQEAFASRPKALILAVNYQMPPDSLFGASDIKVRNLLSRGSVGLVNTNTAGDRSPGDTYASLAFGARARGGPEPLVIDVGESSNGGLTNSGRLLNWSSVTRANIGDELGYGAKPGVAVDALRQAEVKIGVFGLIDSNNSRAGLFGADSKGRLTDIRNIDEPFEDTLEAAHKWTSLQSSSSLTVIELGDVRGREFQRRFVAVGEMVETLKSLKHDIMMIYAAAGPPELLTYGRRMAPVFVYEPGSASRTGTVVGSESTRRVGIVLNTDIMATIFGYLKVPLPDLGVSGRILGTYIPKTIRQLTNYLWSKKQYEEIITRTRLNFINLPIFIGWLILAIVHVLTIYFLRRTKGAARQLLERQLWISSEIVPSLALWWPSAFMLAALQPPTSVAAYSILLFVVLVVPVVGLRVFKSTPIEKLAILSLATCFVIVFDQLSRGSMAARAMMSFDVQGGARFYGIGNEYMGVIVGAFVTFAACAKEKWSAGIGELVVGAIVVCLSIGVPFMGANYVGLVVCILGIGIALSLIYGRRIKLTHIVLLGILALIGLGGMSALDKAFLGGRTHISEVSLQVGREGLIEAFRIINRKLAMSIRVISYTPWTLVFLAALATVLLTGLKSFRKSSLPLLKALSRPWISLETYHPALAGSLRGACVAAIVAFLMEDSGVVAGALAMVYPFFGVAYLYLATFHSRRW